MQLRANGIPSNASYAATPRCRKRRTGSPVMADSLDGLQPKSAFARRSFEGSVLAPSCEQRNTPWQIRTTVSGLRIQRPGPLDEGGAVRFVTEPSFQTRGLRFLSGDRSTSNQRRGSSDELPVRIASRASRDRRGIGSSGYIGDDPPIAILRGSSDAAFSGHAVWRIMGHSSTKDPLFDGHP